MGDELIAGLECYAWLVPYSDAECRVGPDGQCIHEYRERRVNSSTVSSVC